MNGVRSQVVPRGTIRAIMASHRRDLRVVTDDIAREVEHREAITEKPSSSLPEVWSVERGRRQLVDLIARATSSERRSR